MNHRLGFALLLVLLAGCGLSDYEQRMDQERARIKAFDDENKILGDLMDMPLEFMKDKDGRDVAVAGWPFVIFLRLPKDIAKKTDDKEAGVIGNVKLYRYKGAKDGSNVLAAAANVGTRDKDGKLKDGLPPKEFQDEVLLAVDAYLRASGMDRSQFEAPIRKNKERFQPLSHRGEKPPEVEFDVVTYRSVKKSKTAPELMVFFHQSGLRQVAIIHQFLADNTSERTGEAAIPDAIRFGLRSLDIGGSAMQRREDFLKTRR